MVTPNYVAACATVLAGLIAMNIMFTFLHNPNNSKAFEDCVRLEQNNEHSSGENDISVANRAIKRNMLCLWLQNTHLIHQASRLKEVGVNQLEDVYRLEEDFIKASLGSDGNNWPKARQKLPPFQEDLQEFEVLLLKQLKPTKSKWLMWMLECIETVIGFIGKALASFLLFLVASYCWLHYVLPQLRDNQMPAISWLYLKMRLQMTIRNLFSGFFENLNWTIKSFSATACARVTFHWKEPCPVGNTLSFTIGFYHRWTGKPYPVSDADEIEITIKQGDNLIAAAVEVGGSSAEEEHNVRVSFTVRKAGQYHIHILTGSIPIRGSPFIKNFIPGPPDAGKTQLIRPTSMAVCTVGNVHEFLLNPCDEYGNHCSWVANPWQQAEALDQFSVESYNVESNMEVVEPFVEWIWVEVLHRLLLHVAFTAKGIYFIRIKLADVVISKAEFNMIALNVNEAKVVEKDVLNLPSYSAKLLSLNGEEWTKAKKVYCALSPKQIAVKEYFLGFIPSKLATFRLCPSTKVSFQGSRAKKQFPILSIEDGDQSKVEIISENCHLIAAAFASFLLKNIGGSDTFADKQQFFYKGVRKQYPQRSHDKVMLKIRRDQLLLTSMQATKNLGVNDWCKKFQITFVGEEGLDYGGLQREWIELLSVSMFDRRHSGLFASFSDESQALVHPNPKLPPSFKLKHYEFAGKLVGKCLYESSMGAECRQLVKARFSRSFLAQLIGLRVHYKLFEQDDPQFYLSKVKYIEDNDVSDLEITFSEEEYSADGQLLRVVDLVSGGSRIAVTNDNKLRYLDALAQHRLVNPVKEQVSAFIRGLNELVPDHLLSIFDENELELLACGTSEYTINQLRNNVNVVGSSGEFRKVLAWFWIAISNFGAEELSRLLQFTTGSSQLPPGGLAELSPRFQIVASPSFGSLPTAHTCFNQLCLPDYSSYENFERALLLSLKEGSEGFGLA